MTPKSTRENISLKVLMLENVCNSAKYKNPTDSSLRDEPKRFIVRHWAKDSESGNYNNKNPVRMFDK